MKRTVATWIAAVLLASAFAPSAGAADSHGRGRRPWWLRHSSKSYREERHTAVVVPTYGHGYFYWGYLGPSWPYWPVWWRYPYGFSRYWGYRDAYLSPYWDDLYIGPSYAEPDPLPPDSVEMRELGDSFYRTGDYELALSAYTQALGYSRDNMPAWTGSLLALMAQADYGAAAKVATAALRRTQLLRRLQSPLEELDRDAKRFVAEVEEDVRKNPESRRLRLLLAMLHGALGDPLRSWGLYQELAGSGLPQQDAVKLGRLLRKEWGFGRPRAELARQLQTD